MIDYRRLLWSERFSGGSVGRRLYTKQLYGGENDLGGISQYCATQKMSAYLTTGIHGFNDGWLYDVNAVQRSRLGSEIRP